MTAANVHSALAATDLVERYGVTDEAVERAAASLGSNDDDANFVLGYLTSGFDSLARSHRCRRRGTCATCATVARNLAMLAAFDRGRDAYWREVEGR